MGAGWQHPWPVAIYGATLLLSSLAYYILTCSLVKFHDKKSLLNNAIGKDVKGKISVLIYVIAIPLAFVHVTISYLLYVIVAIMWLVPDKRIEEKFLD